MALGLACQEKAPRYYLDEATVMSTLISSSRVSASSMDDVTWFT